MIILGKHVIWAFVFYFYFFVTKLQLQIDFYNVFYNFSGKSTSTSCIFKHTKKGKIEMSP